MMMKTRFWYRPSVWVGTTLLLSSVYVINEAFSEPGGMVNTTLKPGTTQQGCSCHCADENTATTVILEPATPTTTFTVGTPVDIKVTVRNSARLRAGFNVAAFTGNLTAIQGQNTRRVTNKGAGELTQSTPKALASGAASWTFRYTPTQAGTDTLYATGNAVNGDGSSNNGGCRDDWAWAPKFIVEVAPASSVTELPTAKGFTLAVNPNPVRDIATITLGAKQVMAMDVLIYDAAGRVVAQQSKQVSGKTTVSFATKELPNGSYMVEARGNGNVVGRTRLIVAR